MKIAIIGTGYVGLVTGTCFADMGISVTCRLKRGEIPIYEPGLEDMVTRNHNSGRLDFTTDLSEVIDDVEVIFSAVGTPPDEDGSADLGYVLDVARQIGSLMEKYVLVVTKSTVPVGTAVKVREAILEEQRRRGVKIDFDVASNPEFLKEGAAIKDFMSPDRVVVGVESERARKLMTKLYRPFLINNFRVLFMDIPSAEMTKYAANAMLATRISFMNEIANLCDRVGADVEMAGVPVGRVASIKLDDDLSRRQARVVLILDKDLQLPADTIASVKTSGLIGDKYVNLTAGGSEDILASGDTLEETESAVDIESLISKYALGGV